MISKIVTFIFKYKKLLNLKRFLIEKTDILTASLEDNLK